MNAFVKLYEHGFADDPAVIAALQRAAERETESSKRDYMQRILSGESKPRRKKWPTPSAR